MTSIPIERVQALREHNFRRTEARRVKSPSGAERFVRDVGFCHFWPIQGFEIPNLFHAIAGRRRDVPSAHDDPDLSRCWRWKDDALGRRRWYYAKLIGRRATMVSLETLPVFYALSPNYGGEDDYVHEYEAGRLSREARAVYEAIRDGGPMDTVRLRREARLASDSAKAGFERALVELQMGMRLVPVGVAEAGAWRYAFVYDLPTRHIPELEAQAAAWSRSDARAELVARLVDNVVVASRREIARVFAVLRWTERELDGTLKRLTEGQRLFVAPVEGLSGEYFLSPSAMSSARAAPRRSRGIHSPRRR